ncbi:RluA family pseudouridine synthase [Helicovermis profundi]|uniref:RNA pseudouridylate synthase n=1 Tax=Helicovermis profundi TaxID=3065157 RepID=A0AAU9EEM5_9FIRM|nr:RluA family pseudouridine synthase [Clostridia bacterium S502]
MKIENLVIYKDKDVVALVKPYGLASQGAKKEERYFLEMVQNEFNKDDIGLLHRIDKPVGGVILFSKNKNALIKLNEDIKNKKIRKFYYVVIYGELENEEGVFEDYLLKMKTTNMSAVSSKEKKSSKKSSLKYRVLDVKMDLNDNKISLVEVELITGRHHQIRVQFSSRGYYILGDKKYKNNRMRNDVYENIALWSYKIIFNHPRNGKSITVKKLPEAKDGFAYFDCY